MPVGEDGCLDSIDSDAWKYEDWAGFDTLVIHTVNDDRLIYKGHIRAASNNGNSPVSKAKAINDPPGNYNVQDWNLKELAEASNNGGECYLMR